MRGALVVAEMALAVMLLAGAGLLMRSFVKLQSVDPGFKLGAGPDVRSVAARRALRARRAAGVAFFDQLLPRLRALPGVRGGVGGDGAAAERHRLQSSRSRWRAVRRCRRRSSRRCRCASRRRTTSARSAFRSSAAARFTDDDTAGTPRVVLLTESAARQFFPNEDPIGKTIKLGWGRGAGKAEGRR